MWSTVAVAGLEPVEFRYLAVVLFVTFAIVLWMGGRE